MKQREIKDYLHLYLGCQCKGDEGTMTYTLSTVHKSGQGSILVDEMGNVCTMIPFRLILRPLSDMTEVEIAEVNSKGAEGWQLINPINSDRPQDIHSGVVHRQAFEVHYLLSKGFDLFGLIEEGLALDKTKL